MITEEFVQQCARRSDQLAEIAIHEMAGGRDPIDKRELYPFVVSTIFEMLLKEQP